MLFPKNSSASLSLELFQNPAAEYRGMPFWSWNCRIAEDLIDRQTEIFKKMGYGGAHLHPRIGMETPYLSEEYMRMIRRAVKKFKEHGLYAWLYDDDRCPSGAADGFVTSLDPDYAGRVLLLTEACPSEPANCDEPYILPGYSRDREEFPAPSATESSAQRMRHGDRQAAGKHFMRRHYPPGNAHVHRRAGLHI